MFTVEFFWVSVNTVCRWSKNPRRRTYCPFPRLLILMQRPSSGKWKTEEKGENKEQDEQEATLVEVRSVS